MVFLFDDKIGRQNDFYWNDEKFLEFKDVIIPIYKYNDKIGIDLKIFSPGNVILYHESFFDGDENAQLYNSFSKFLSDYAANNDGSKVVFFSGSKFNRIIIDNLGYIPVSELYKNLRIFLLKQRESDFNLKYLFFGANYDIEEFLISKLVQNNNNYESDKIDDSGLRNFFIQTLEKSIPEPYTNAIYNSFFDDNITDKYLNNLVIEWLKTEEYDNIFIPLCFGQTLSDYNGLRLATHIRCTETPNRFKNIFIYSFIGHSYLINNEYFDILKTKNIHLINYKKKSFESALKTEDSQLNLKQLTEEITKIRLLPPKNYQDNHSVINEWAIFRWAHAIGISSDGIEKIIEKIDNNLYFKYLQTIYPISEIEKLSDDKLKINYGEGSKVLYIGDEAEKGWNIIFQKFFSINSISFDYLDSEFKSKSQIEIIDISYSKIVKDNIDLVILDFRLHNSDFNNLSTNEITGIKLLKKIKAYNPGIQVIIFSATNKIWNLQVMQRAGVDGFIIKESPENSINIDFTNESILMFKNNLSVLNRIFLKHFYNLTKKIKKNIDDCDDADSPEFKYFLNDLNNQIIIIETTAKKINLKDPLTLDIVFLTCYNFLEKFKNFYLKEESYHFFLGIDEIEMNRYIWKKNFIQTEGVFVRKGNNDYPTWFHCLSSLFIDYFSIFKEDDSKLDILDKVKTMRNDYIHENKNKFNKEELMQIIDLCYCITTKLRE